MMFMPPPEAACIIATSSGEYTPRRARRSASNLRSMIHLESLLRLHESRTWPASADSSRSPESSRAVSVTDAAASRCKTSDRPRERTSGLEVAAAIGLPGQWRWPDRAGAGSAGGLVDRVGLEPTEAGLQGLPACAPARNPMPRSVAAAGLPRPDDPAMHHRPHLGHVHLAVDQLGDERQGHAIGLVRGLETALARVLLGLELNAHLAVVAVGQARELVGQVVVVGHLAGLEPRAHRTPGFGALVEILVHVLGRLAPHDGHERDTQVHALQDPIELGAVADGVVDDRGDGRVLARQVLHAPADVEPVKALQLDLEQHALALAQRDDGRVIAEPRRIDRQELLVDLVDARIQPAPARLGDGAWRDEVVVARAREHPLDAHAHEVRILAVLLDPGLDRRLVRERDRAAVHARVGRVLVAPRLCALVEELARGARGVAGAQPEDLGLGIG